MRSQDLLVCIARKYNLTAIFDISLWFSSKDMIEAIGKTYPGRASVAPVLDVFITLLDLGASGYVPPLRVAPLSCAMGVGGGGGSILRLCVLDRRYTGTGATVYEWACGHALTKSRNMVLECHF